MRNSRSTRVVILVSAIFAALELPAVASKLVNDALVNVHSVSLHSLHLAANLCVVVDSLVNFVAYLSANRSFRRSLRHQMHALLRCCCCCCCLRCSRHRADFEYDEVRGGGTGIASFLTRGSSEYLQHRGGRSRRAAACDGEFTDSSVVATTQAGAGNGSEPQLSTFSWLLRSSPASLRSDGGADRNARVRYSVPDCRVELHLIQQEQQPAQNSN